MIDDLDENTENEVSCHIEGSRYVNTGSSRSTVASEETDVCVMFSGEVDITGISVGSLCRN